MQSLLNADEPKPSRAAPRQHGRPVESDAIVPNAATQPRAVLVQRNEDAGRLGVLRHVGQRLLHDAVQRRLCRRGKPLSRRALYHDLKPCPARDPIGEELEGRAEPTCIPRIAGLPSRSAAIRSELNGRSSLYRDPLGVFDGHARTHGSRRFRRTNVQP